MRLALDANRYTDFSRGERDITLILEEAAAKRSATGRHPAPGTLMHEVSF